MNNSKYLKYAQQACEKEREKQWDEARELWLKAEAFVLPNTQNQNWAWARASFCNTQLSSFLQARSQPLKRQLRKHTTASTI